MVIKYRNYTTSRVRSLSKRVNMMYHIVTTVMYQIHPIILAILASFSVSQGIQFPFILFLLQKSTLKRNNKKTVCGLIY